MAPIVFDTGKRNVSGRARSRQLGFLAVDLAQIAHISPVVGQPPLQPVCTHSRSSRVSALLLLLLREQALGYMALGYMAMAMALGYGFGPWL